MIGKWDKNFLTCFDVLLTNLLLLSILRAWHYFHWRLFGSPSIVHFCFVPCLNLLNIGLHNGESEKALLPDQLSRIRHCDCYLSQFDFSNNLMVDICFNLSKSVNHVSGIWNVSGPLMCIMYVDLNWQVRMCYEVPLCLCVKCLSGPLMCDSYFLSLLTSQYVLRSSALPLCIDFTVRMASFSALLLRG